MVVCVWPGTIVGKEHIAEFEAWLKEEFDVTGKYLEEVLTLPDIKDGNEVAGTGGRTDVFFTVDGDIGRFAIMRLPYGMRWWEDVVGNKQTYLYPRSIVAKYNMLQK